MRKGIFTMANRLYGLTFKEVTNVPVYHPDVKAYDVFDCEGKHLATFMSDYYARKGKRQGAWMFVFQEATEQRVCVLSSTTWATSRLLLPEDCLADSR